MLGRRGRSALGLLLLVACAEGARLAQAAQAQDAQPGPNADCDANSKPGKVTVVKANVVDGKTVDVLWLPPGDGGCFDTFIVSGKNVATGAALPTKKINDAMSTSYDELTSGGQYEFSVAATGPAGDGPKSSARAATPPAFLTGVKPDAPEALNAAAVDATTAKLTWQRPSGNPKVDSYSIKAVQVNGTGFPLPGGTNKTFSAKGDALSATLPGLQADTYYVFVVTAKNSVGSSAEPAVTFHAMPSAGQTAPGAPAGVSAAQATKDTVALQWQPPAGSPPDFYNIGITEVDASGNPVSATNVIPYKNTTALIRDLQPGSTYNFKVQSYSTSFDAGKSAQIRYTVPQNYVPPPQQAALVPPGNINAAVYGNQVQMAWEPSPSAAYYSVSVYDAYSGRNLGLQYQTQQNGIDIDGLPVSQALQVVVQAVDGSGYYSDPSTATVEIPAPPSGYYEPTYSPYVGYNPYMPSWYSNYYPIGYYNTWYPGKWVLNGIANCLNPFNYFWGAGWWLSRPWGAFNPLGPLNPFSPFRPNWGWGWGWGGIGWNRPWGGAIAGGIAGGIVGGIAGGIAGGIWNRFPGQRPIPSVRPQPIGNAIRPRPGVGRPVTRPATLPGGLTRPSQLPSFSNKGPLTRPALPGAGSAGRPTTRPAVPGAGGAGLKPAPGTIPGAMTRPAPGTGLARPGGLPGGATTRPALPATPFPGAGGAGLARPGGGLPTTRPALPATPFPGGRPSVPMTRPGGVGGMTRPSVPMTRPSVPMTRPSVPMARPSMPMTRPVMPMTRPAMPMARPMPSYGGGGFGGGGGFRGGYGGVQGIRGRRGLREGAQD